MIGYLPNTHQIPINTLLMLWAVLRKILHEDLRWSFRVFRCTTFNAQLWLYTLFSTKLPTSHFCISVPYLGIHSSFSITPTKVFSEILAWQCSVHSLSLICKQWTVNRRGLRGSERSGNLWVWDSVIRKTLGEKCDPVYYDPDYYYW